MFSWTAPLGKLGSHRRQTLDAIVNVFHRLAAGGYDHQDIVFDVNNAQFITPIDALLVIN